MRQWAQVCEWQLRLWVETQVKPTSLSERTERERETEGENGGKKQPAQTLTISQHSVQCVLEKNEENGQMGERNKWQT